MPTREAATLRKTPQQKCDKENTNQKASAFSCQLALSNCSLNRWIDISLLALQAESILDYTHWGIWKQIKIWISYFLMNKSLSEIWKLIFLLSYFLCIFLHILSTLVIIKFFFLFKKSISFANFIYLFFKSWHSVSQDLYYLFLISFNLNYLENWKNKIS